MKASEAIKLTELANSAEHNPQYKKIIKKIKSAAKKGYYNVWYYDYINDDVTNLLKKNGFEMDVDNTRNRISINITWK